MINDMIEFEDEFYVITKILKTHVMARPISLSPSGTDYLKPVPLYFKDSRLRWATPSELRLLYLQGNRCKQKEIYVDKSILPNAKKGCKVGKLLNRDKHFVMHWFDLHGIRHAQKGFSHFTFYTKRVHSHQWRGVDVPTWTTIYPYQACPCSFVNDGTRIFHKTQWYQIPEHLQLVNATMVLSKTGKLALEIVKELHVDDELFVNYGKKFWKGTHVAPLTQPMFIFGDIPKHKLHSQLHELYDWCYDCSNVIEDTESEEDELNTPLIEEEFETLPEPQTPEIPREKTSAETDTVKDPEEPVPKRAKVRLAGVIDVPTNAKQHHSVFSKRTKVRVREAGGQSFTFPEKEVFEKSISCSSESDTSDCSNSD